jgi:hypothetical protein
MSERHIIDRPISTIEEAIAYITPHPLTKGPVILTADKLREAVVTIVAESMTLRADVAWWERQSKEAGETVEAKVPADWVSAMAWRGDFK